jgi:uncharacterized protein (TIGR02466 family)
MANVEMWFPVSIYKQEGIITTEQNDRLREHCLQIQANTPTGGAEWLGGTYNTHQTHDLSNDPEFQPVLEAASYHVHEFAKMHNCNGTYKNNYAWLNIATDNAWQEFHTHNGNIFSLVYYVDAPEGSGKIIFEDPKEPDMYPLKTVNNKNQLSYSRISYTPGTGLLLIFRSYLRHAVEPGTNTDPRISIAMNFN